MFLLLSLIYGNTLVELEMTFGLVKLSVYPLLIQIIIEDSCGIGPNVSLLPVHILFPMIPIVVVALSSASIHIKSGSADRYNVTILPGLL